MEPMTSVLHLNSRWANSNSPDKRQFSEMVSKHCILELFECDAIKLNDEAFVRTTVMLAAKISGAQLLNLITHRFQPQGVTGLALLAESHISIHTWPESRYAAVDVFTCGYHTIPEKACEFLCKEFESQRFSLQNLRRATPPQLTNNYRKSNKS